MTEAVRFVGAQRIFAATELWEEFEWSDAARRLDWTPEVGERVWVMHARRRSGDMAEPSYSPAKVTALEEGGGIHVWTCVEPDGFSPGRVSIQVLQPRSWIFPEDEDDEGTDG